MDKIDRIPKNNNGKRIHQYNGFYSIELKKATWGELYIWEQKCLKLKLKRWKTQWFSINLTDYVCMRMIEK